MEDLPGKEDEGFLSSVTESDGALETCVWPRYTYFLCLDGKVAQRPSG